MPICKLPRLCTMRAATIEGKVYLFFDEIQEVTDWEKCIHN